MITSHFIILHTLGFDHINLLTSAKLLSIYGRRLYHIIIFTWYFGGWARRLVLLL